MAGGWESLGLLPELVQTVEEDFDWILPSAIQDECIPLLLGGGDVMVSSVFKLLLDRALILLVTYNFNVAWISQASAETGSGKTGMTTFSAPQILSWVLLHAFGSFRFGNLNNYCS